MPPQPQGPALTGTLRIFQVAGISVYVHWSWLVIAAIEFQFRRDAYGNYFWPILEYVSLFGIVLLHEFGHAFACRQVGGRADSIVLWPLGGVALVMPPPRPGAWLWSIVAGPLVNVVLVPITIGLVFAGRAGGLEETDDFDKFLVALAAMNVGLLVFNMLPIYPLDGGQALHALLWFVIGRAKSLMVACIVGLIGAVAFIGVAIFALDIWIGIMAAMGAYRCWQGIQQARLMSRIEEAPRHLDATCPSCDAHPLQGPFWHCDLCRARFDTFETQAECPNCLQYFTTTMCPECGASHPIWAWYDQKAPIPYRRRDDDES
jgi:Zn-dependent protease